MPLRSYLLAFTAILLWSSLATIASRLHGHDPLVVTGLGLAIGGALSLPRWRSWVVPWRTFAIGCGGFLGYHALYFTAFSLAPAMEVNVLNYLWPLAMIVLSPVILKERLDPRQVLGAILGLAGTAILLAKGGAHPAAGEAVGCACALLAALIWGSYSLATKRLPPFPTPAVGGFCLCSGLAALGIASLWHHHLGAELASFHDGEWGLVVLAGIGPLGLAFYCWDAALKSGHPPTIAVLAYLTPLLSTLGLILSQGQGLALRVAAALAVIILGSLIGGWRSSARRPG